MKILKIIRTKAVIFLVQIALLSVLIIIFGYSFEIEFDGSISEERKQIIQFLGNYVMFDGFNDTLLIYCLWLVVVTIPIIIFRKVKRVYSMNLLTFFVPNFFFYVFLSRYSPLYFNQNFGQLIFDTIILALVLIAYSFIFSLVVNFIRKKTKKEEPFQIRDIDKKVVSICPQCGTKFDSKPLYCYKCNAKLIDETPSVSKKKAKNESL
ncbi:MAG: zinc ribbon domain-containing protein [Promethearchaeota archaeon]|nr:MAG: zinc ribbon domain-containing protein [Candidatus Lokiarchaeota archaeon]